MPAPQVGRFLFLICQRIFSKSLLWRIWVLKELHKILQDFSFFFLANPHALLEELTKELVASLRTFANVTYPHSQTMRRLPLGTMPLSNSCDDECHKTRAPSYRERMPCDPLNNGMHVSSFAIKSDKRKEVF